MGEDTPVIAHEWRRIANLPENWRDLCRRDLHAVHHQWTEDRNLIRDPAKLDAFRDRLHMLWAIETGIIERLYPPPDRGVTVSIAQAGLEALGQFHARGLISADARALIADQRAALDMVMDLVGGQQNLTAFFIRSLHYRLTLSQDTCEAEDQSGNRFESKLLKGAWKKQPNNPRRPDGSIHKYCPPEHVQDEIDQLLSWHNEHDMAEVCPEVEAAWLHHCFAQIHPFQDGNGRVARALTAAVFLKADHLVLVVRDEDRERYIEALETADDGELKPLVDLFADRQITDLQEAMGAIRELRGETVITATESVAERARRRKDAVRDRAAGVMDDLLQIASVRLEETVGELYRSFRAQGVEVSAQVRADDEDRRDWWSWQIIDAARHHQYYAELDRPRRWVSMQLRLPEIERDETRFVVSLHAVGRAADLHAVTAFLTNPVTSGKGDEPKRWESRIVPGRPFQFRAETDKVNDIGSQFRAWLETAIENGLSFWGERL